MASSHWLFGSFRLDPDNACLWHGEQARPLTPKAFNVLQYLVTHADRLITKDELFEVLWPDTVVSEAALRVCIGELRKALGDAARAPQFIATVARRGYRFLAPVTHKDLAAETGSDADSRPHALAASAGPFVGREKVLDRLHTAWAQVRQGVRQVCLVTGEAGIGKTAVVEAFVAQVTTDPAVWLAQGQCVEHYGTREAYLPVLEALGQMVRAPGGGPPGRAAAAAGPHLVGTAALAAHGRRSCTVPARAPGDYPGAHSAGAGRSGRDPHRRDTAGRGA
jgi:DNA-binding winged helix-turn-helix (wHTH) protein